MKTSGSAGELGLLLSRASRRWTGILAGHLGRLDITPGQAPILLVLLTEDSKIWTETALAAEVGQAQQTVSTHVARLERVGLIDRIQIRSSAGRLVYRVTVSQAGEERGDELLQALGRAEFELTAEVSPDERSGMSDVLRRIADLPLVPAQARGVSTAQ